MSNIYPVILLYVFVIGICIGSFLNVVILRGLSGENIVIARSKCPKCNNQLKWYMNIPLLSYIFLKGKCAFCKEKISIQYPIIEFITGVSFLGSYLVFGLSLKTLFVCIFLCCFIVLATTDILETVIIELHTYILLAAALLYSFLNLGEVTILYSVIGAIFAFVFFEIIARLGYLFTSYRAFGEGDSYIALGLGAIFGIKNFIILVFLSFLISSSFAIPFLIKKAYNEKNIKLFFSYLITLFSIILLFIAFYINLINNNYYLYLIFSITVSAFIFWALFNIYASFKNKYVKDFDEAKNVFNIIPFGPSLILSATILLFYIEPIKNLIRAYLF